MNLHVKEFTIHRVDHQLGFVIEGCPAGQGRLDVPWLLRELHSGRADSQRHPGTMARAGVVVRGHDRERGAMGGGEREVPAYTDRELKPRDIEEGIRTMTKIALLGAAGKMGSRISRSLADEPQYEVLCVEGNAEGEQKLQARGDRAGR